MTQNVTYRGRRLVDMTKEQLRAALAETIKTLGPPPACAGAPARGITLEQVTTRRIDEAFNPAMSLDPLAKMARRISGIRPKDGPELRAMAAALHHRAEADQRVAVIWLRDVRNARRLEAIEEELSAQYGNRNPEPP